MENEEDFYTFQPYCVPKWAESFKDIPTRIVKLSHLNTPIHKWNLPGVPSDVEIFIKRDDLTGAELSRSKTRPLQLLFAEALDEGAKHVVTGGGAKSGFNRAVCLTSRLLGLTPHIIVLGGQEIKSLGAQGNILLCRLAGGKIYVAPEEHLKVFDERIVKMAQNVSVTYGEKCYAIPIGGATAKSVFMYLSMFEELLNQGLSERFDDMVTPIGAAGLAVGLAIGNYLTGFLSDFITKVSSTTGILLDPYYTGKAAIGMMEEVHVNPHRFKGKRILFIQTGGIFNLFDGEMDRVIFKKGANTNDIVNC